MKVPEDLQSILNDTTLFNASSDITTKEILKRYGDIGAGGGPKQTVEIVDQPPSALPRSKDGSSGGNPPRAMAPVVTRVDTDPYQAHARQKESSVRHIQEAPGANPNNQNTPPQQWQQSDLEPPPATYPQRAGTPDSHSGSENHRRDWRNSQNQGWGRPQNGHAPPVTGAS